MGMLEGRVNGMELMELFFIGKLKIEGDSILCLRANDLFNVLKKL